MQKQSFGAIFLSFGGYLSFVLKMTSLTINGFQRSSLQNSMIKRLYSKNKEEDDDNSDSESEEEKTDGDKDAGEA